MSFILRTLAGLLVAMVGTVAFSGTAWAHVTVSADDVSAGHDVKAVFRVPDERDDASTVRVEVSFPTDHPLSAVSVAAVPGWAATVRKRTLAVPVHAHDGGEITEVVESVVWQGGAIKPGEFVEFPVAIGALPHDVERLVFKALQSYSDGQVVRWIETPAEGAPQPQYPAPVLSLAAGHGVATGSGVDPLARAAGLAGLIAAFGALAGCVLVVVPVRSRRATRAPATAPRHDAVAQEKARV
jgi:uncharacterized protein YcnI